MHIVKLFDETLNAFLGAVVVSVLMLGVALGAPPAQATIYSDDSDDTILDLDSDMAATAPEVAVDLGNSAGTLTLELEYVIIKGSDNIDELIDTEGATAGVPPDGPRPYPGDGNIIQAADTGPLHQGTLTSIDNPARAGPPSFAKLGVV